MIFTGPIMKLSQMMNSLEHYINIRYHFRFYQCSWICGCEINHSKWFSQEEKNQPCAKFDFDCPIEKKIERIEGELKYLSERTYTPSFFDHFCLLSLILDTISKEDAEKVKIEHPKDWDIGGSILSIIHVDGRSLEDLQTYSDMYMSIIIKLGRQRVLKCLG